MSRQPAVSGVHRRSCHHTGLRIRPKVTCPSNQCRAEGLRVSWRRNEVRMVLACRWNGICLSCGWEVKNAKVILFVLEGDCKQEAKEVEG
jgi:hypothetical protein